MFGMNPQMLFYSSRLIFFVFVLCVCVNVPTTPYSCVCSGVAAAGVTEGPAGRVGRPTRLLRGYAPRPGRPGLEGAPGAAAAAEETRGRGGHGAL